MGGAGSNGEVLLCYGEVKEGPSFSYHGLCEFFWNPIVLEVEEADLEECMAELAEKMGLGCGVLCL